MEYKGRERRAHERVKIPGARVSYNQRRLFFSKKKYVEEFCPVVEISRGGIRFLGQRLLTTFNKILLRIFIPEESSYITLQGHVKWTSLNPTLMYRYQIGVQFDPYGEKKGFNNPEIRDRIIALEEKFLATEKSDIK